MVRVYAGRWPWWVAVAFGTATLVEGVAMLAAVAYEWTFTAVSNDRIPWAAVEHTALRVWRYRDRLLPASQLGIDGMLLFVVAAGVVLLWPMWGNTRGAVVARWVVVVLGAVPAVIGTLFVPVALAGVAAGLDQELVTEGAYHRLGGAIVWWLCVLLPKVPRVREE